MSISFSYTLISLFIIPLLDAFMKRATFGFFDTVTILKIWDGISFFVFRIIYWLEIGRIRNSGGFWKEEPGGEKGSF